MKNLSLSAQKSKKRTSLSARNVLANPKIAYWPVVSLSGGELLTKQLQECLTYGRIDKYNSNIFKKLGRSKIRGKADKRNFLNVIPVEEECKLKKALHHRNFLVCGVNDVTRGIESNRIMCCLLAEEAKPKMLVKHVAIMAQHSNIATLVIPNLKSITQQSLGFACLALGFKRTVVEEIDNIFQEVCNSIKEMSKSMFEELNTQVTHLVQSDADDILKLLGTHEFRNTVDIRETNKTDLYLYRNSIQLRVFKPFSLSENSDVADTFLPLNSNPGQNSFKLQKCSKRKGLSQYSDESFLSQSKRDPIEAQVSEEGSHEKKDDSLVLADPLCTPKNKSHTITNYNCPRVLRVQSNQNKFRKDKVKRK